MGVGGAVDVFAGRKKRAPGWLQRSGLEWFYRFLQDPRRLAGRYIVGNARFMALLARELAAQRLGRRTGAAR
jgi:N-acetylglucosaminyldiphosphoundecaprenol N-acetyl-beta-D-mannosaminyltransferase